MACIRFVDSGRGVARFKVDVGRNRWYAYAIGEGGTQRRNGLTMLDARSHTSELLGPLDPSEDGRTELEVPTRLFSGRDRSIQLMSFRTPGRDGPALSEIVVVPPNLDLSGDGLADLPEISMTRSRTLAAPPRQAAAIPTVRRALAPARPLSTAQFLDGLLALLPQILPAAGSILGGLLDGGGAKGPSGPPAGGGDLQQLVAQILKALAPAGAAAPAPAKADAKSLALGMSRGMDRGAKKRGRYSEAAVAPALLAALPALMPVLQQVLSPETIKGLFNMVDPKNVLGAVTDAVTSVGKLGLDAEKQELEHLRALNPGVDDPALNQLLLSMSAHLEEPRAHPRYRRVPTVRLTFTDLVETTVDGRTVTAFLLGRALLFPLMVQTPRPLPEARLVLILKDATTLEPLARTRVAVPAGTAGPLPEAPGFPVEDLQRLVAGRDYLVCAHLIWRNKRGDKVGAAMSHSIHMVGEHSPGAVDATGPAVPLDDVGRHRDFWHKVWEDELDDDHRRIELEARYVTLMEPDRTTNARVETVVRTEPVGVRKLEGRLKSGLVLCPNALNELLPDIAGAPMLAPTELAALMTPGFVRRFGLSARSSVKFAGRGGATVALWVFPEVKVATIALQRAADVAPSGQVLRFEPRHVSFPLPCKVHFVGTSSAP
ncbi:hypothetical protein [Skermanella stibiiresistens]|uniref:hypothetical protein n=1 Tax=Skermanella stibiiresistens TaxID=913326 RepID=UPI0012F9E85F|nr:hypothetical protein [Skermanella stibiiresistens]